MRLGMRLAWLALSVASGVVTAAAPPATWRELTAEERRRISDLIRDAGGPMKRGDYAKVAELARQVAAVREKAQGTAQWQAVDMRFFAQRWERLAKLPEGTRKRIAAALEDRPRANALARQNRMHEAETADRAILAVLRRELGEAHPETSLGYRALADHLSDQGRYADALPLYEKALAIARRALGEGHPDTAQCYNSLGHCLSALGKRAQALPLREKALAIRQEALGERHPETATSYNNVASDLTELGKHARAQQLSQKALAIRLALRGEKHPEVAQSYNNVAAALAAQGKYHEAEALHRKALAIWRDTLGDSHRSTAAAYNNLAASLEALGKFAEAHLLYEKSLAIRREVLGEEHPDTAAGYNNLANYLARLGSYARAQPLQEKVVATTRKSLGEGHPTTATAYANLASTLVAQGKFAEALPLYERALAIWREALGEEHAHTALGYGNLAHLFARQKKFAEAQRLQEKGLAIREKALGEHHPAVAGDCSNLASYLSHQNKLAEAGKLHERALAIARKALGDNHPDTATFYANLAGNHAARKKYAEAQPLLETALAIRRRTLGEEHAHTATDYTNLASLLLARGRHREAIGHLRAALLGFESGRLTSSDAGFDRSLYLSGLVSTRALLAVCLAGVGRDEEAWQAAEADLARGLLDEARAGNEEDRALLARRDAINLQLLPLLLAAEPSAAQRKERDDLLAERKKVGKDLAARAARRSEALVLSRKEIQQAIPADSALVFWLDVSSEHLGCVLRREGPPRFEVLPGSGGKDAWIAEDDELPRKVYLSLVDPATGPEARRKLAAALRKQRLGPLARHFAAAGRLPAVKRLLVVPAGRMASVPVEVIAPEYLVSYVPSGSVLARLAKEHRALEPTSLLALGDPAFDVPSPKHADPPADGLLVLRVTPGGPADRGGVRPGDLLLEYGGKKLATAEDLEAAAKGRKVEALVWRDGKELTLALDGGAPGAAFDPRSARAAVRAWRASNAAVKRGTGHRRLPGTRVEVEALRGLFGPSRLTLLLGSDASEQRLDELIDRGELKKYRVVHLATHGEADAGSPLRSALVLAQDRLPDPLGQARRGRKVYDGLLRVRTVLDGWRLDADLVVLSACRTGLGKDAGGEGLLGFSQAFLSRGARSVVLSRWSVDDTATSLLMVRFYENLLGSRKGTKPLGRAAAIDEAKRWLRKLTVEEAKKAAESLPRGKLVSAPGGKAASYEHPHYWAGFVLVGDYD